MKLKKLAKDKLVLSIGPIIIALALYLLGLRLFLMPTILCVFSLLIPYPSILKSFFSRLVVSLLLFYSIYQIAAVLQLYIFSYSSFRAGSILVSGVSILLILVCSRKTVRSVRPLLAKEDIYGIIVSAFFIVPIAVYCLSGNSLQKAANIGSIQGNDGATHFMMLTEASVNQRYTYAKGALYYPFGFHLTTAFAEDSIHLSHAKQNWATNARLYIAEYLAMAGILAFAVYYACLYFLRIMKGSAVSHGQKALAALSIGPPLMLFYLIPFLYNGFLNYFYIIATIIFALLFIIDPESDVKDDYPSAYQLRRFFIGLLLLFGASSSWPLFVPLVLLIALCFCSQGLVERFRYNKGSFISREAWLVYFGVGLQLIPLLLQLAYSGSSTSEGLNASGALKVFPTSLFLFCGVFIGYLITSKDSARSLKAVLSNVFVPSIAFVTLLAAYQYFDLGELRYYVIKIAMVLEIMVLALFVAWLINKCINADLTLLSMLVIVIISPTILVFALISFNNNPLKDLRDLFRDYSHEAKPAYVSQDALNYAKIGKDNDVKDYNSIALHYSQDKMKLFAHVQTAYWANTISFKPNMLAYGLKDCHYKAYLNMLLGNFTDQEQTELIDNIKQCAMLANNIGNKYYIVTDAQSAPYIENIFQHSVEIVK